MYTPEGAFTRTWHWIDASDAAPSSCNVHLNRDCSGTGCLVSAIANHTQRFASCVERAQHGSLKNGLDLECSRSLKLFVIFCIAAKLPLSFLPAWPTSSATSLSLSTPVALLLGATSTPSPSLAARQTCTRYAFDSLFLRWAALTHFSAQVWDGRIIRQLANVNTFDNSSITPFFAESVKKTRRDAFSDSTRNWLSCNDPSTPVACALAWARDTNEWNCDYTYRCVFLSPFPLELVLTATLQPNLQRHRPGDVGLRRRSVPDRRAADSQVRIATRSVAERHREGWDRVEGHYHLAQPELGIGTDGRSLMEGLCNQRTLCVQDQLVNLALALALRCSQPPFIARPIRTSFAQHSSP